MRKRNGSLLLEVCLAVTLLAVALVSVAQLLALAARQSRETRWRSVATQEVANVTERVMALPWSKTTTDQLDAVSVPNTALELPDPTLAIEAIDVTEPRVGKQIRISLSYRNTAGLPVEPVTMVAWKFLPGGSQ